MRRALVVAAVCLLAGAGSAGAVTLPVTSSPRQLSSRELRAVMLGAAHRAQRPLGLRVLRVIGCRRHPDGGGACWFRFIDAAPSGDPRLSRTTWRDKLTLHHAHGRWWVTAWLFDYRSP